MISIVVPNHNRDLSVLKESIRRSTYKDVELIVVNLGYERSKQRNIGIEKAKGDAILWLDSDQSISPNLILECSEILKTGVSAIFVPEVIVARSFFGRIRAFERSFLTGTAVDVPRVVLKRICPRFDETLAGPEDADFGQKIPGIKTVSRNVLYHHDDIGFLEYCKKKAYYTKSMARYRERYPFDPCLNLKYRCFQVYVENGKWKRLLMHPILTIGIVFLLIVRGIIYAKA